jgi:hypothetical protein
MGGYESALAVFEKFPESAYAKNYESALAIFEKFSGASHVNAYEVFCREALAKKRPDV